MSAQPRSTNWLADAAAREPDAAALLSPDGARVSWAQLLAEARVEAEVAGLAPGPDPITLELEPGISHAVAVHAAILAGVPFATVRPGLPAAEREAVLAAAASSPALPGTLARVLSSGTTGARRPIDLSAANFEASARASAANLGVEAGDLWLACLPMDHVGGLSILIRSAIYGTAALIHPGFDVDAVAAALAADEPRVSLISLVPTQLRRLLDAGAPLERLRVALIGGAALDHQTLERAFEAGAPVVQSYGLTEACSQVATLAPGDARGRPGSSGRALPGIDLRVEEGRIEVRGPTVAPGSADPDGWLRTGDAGRLDEDGYLWVEGRIDDVIVSGGENVRPEPVEDLLRAEPDVADAAVVGRPDPGWGEIVVAVVVPAPGAEPDPETLIARCKASLAPAMVPKLVEFAAELPRTASGKLQRAQLRNGPG